MKTYTEEEVRLLLAEQHRNTRHDAIEMISGLAASNISGQKHQDFFDAGHEEGAVWLANEVNRDLINLKQRSPLDEKQ